MEFARKFKSKILEYQRVYRITKKPNMEEFKAVSKVTALGILLIGLIGFAIHMVSIVIRGG